jgi:hypothetical protein
MNSTASPRVGLMIPYGPPDWDQATARAFLDGSS